MISLSAAETSSELAYPDHSGSRQFLRGGDLTMVNYIEDFGAKFRYEDGTEADVFDILSNYGVNFARLRLYNAPGTAVKNGSTTYRMPIITPAHPSGYANSNENLRRTPDYKTKHLVKPMLHFFNKKSVTA